MERERKGCLIMIISILINGTGIYVATEYEWLYLRFLCMMLMCMMGTYIGNTYYCPKANKPISKKQWIWYFLAIFVLAGIMTWIIECNTK